MPIFDRVPLGEAKMKTASGSSQRAQALLSMSATLSSLGLVKRVDSRQRKENRSRPFDGDSALRQGSWGGS